MTEQGTDKKSANNKNALPVDQADSANLGWTNSDRFIKIPVYKAYCNFAETALRTLHTNTQHTDFTRMVQMPRVATSYIMDRWRSCMREHSVQSRSSRVHLVQPATRQIRLAPTMKA